MTVDVLFLIIGASVVCWSPDYITEEEFVITPATKCIEFNNSFVDSQCVQKFAKNLSNYEK